MEAVFFKDPTAVLDYAMDWATWLGTAENISTYAITPDSSLITVSTHAQSSGVVTAWLTGGSAGSNHTIAIRIETDASRVDERSFMLKIRNR